MDICVATKTCRDIIKTLSRLPNINTVKLMKYFRCRKYFQLCLFADRPQQNCDHVSENVEACRATESLIKISLKCAMSHSHL